MENFVLITGIILLILSLFFYLFALKKRKEKIKLDTETLILYENKTKQIKERLSLELEKIKEIEKKKESLYNSLEKESKAINKTIANQKNTISDNVKIFKENIDLASKSYFDILESQYRIKEKEYDNKIIEINERRASLEKELNKIKETLSAGVQAQLREEEKKKKIDFYKISISEKDLFDIKTLNQIKKTLNNPTILSKLIWSTFFQKQVSEMCNRIFGTKVICGIYRITNLLSQKVYIGQSVNVSERIKTHCRCGCDIDASSTNKLYQDMIETGIWNFSFELMEECKREELNEKEKKWIEMYQSDIYGLNTKAGNR